MATTRPTTMRWSPPVWTAWIRQSIQAGTASSCGEPVTGAGAWVTPANLSAPLTANDRHSSPCPAPRMLTQNTPARAIRGQVVDVRATMKVTRGGSRDREAKDWQAKPAGPPPSSPAGAVMTVTPLAKLPRTARNSAGETGARSSSPTARRSGRGRASTGSGSRSAEAEVGEPTDLRYRTTVAAIPACPITPSIEPDGSSDRKRRVRGACEPLT